MVVKATRNIAILVALSLSTSSTFAAALNGAGSSFSEGLYKKWGAAYGAATGKDLSFTPTDSGEGIKSVLERRSDFGASDEPLKSNDLEARGIAQYPVALGGLVMAINLPGIPAGQVKLTPELISDIYLGKIKRWNDPKIVELNSQLPAKALDVGIIPIYRTEPSGSTFILSSYLDSTNTSWKAAGKGVKSAVTGLSGLPVKGSSAVVETLKKTIGGIAYLDYGRAAREKLDFTQLPNRMGVFLSASAESIQASTQYEAEKARTYGDSDFYLVLANNDTYRGWPLSMATFVVVPKAGKDVNSVLDFIYWGYKNGDSSLREAGYVPLPDAMKLRVRQSWSRRFGYKAGF
ncbi:phosphate ABC transporter substrate-binding protein PstS [Parachitinimonas caeni]|uniref:Phosphate-binding protein PstS n=1 Tax=Parachitinimonas caeni TaxID=3031301 RepID=A0ABT7DXI6_9NEIS|nr:phosphate ABC transporter substrate-binding protein PstS [Parachitinimonas caeni]MDK2123357.1 phosphate ABC transporter substrate-binding protein PstS [Parachitinimonas caeni]